MKWLIPALALGAFCVLALTPTACLKSPTEDDHQAIEELLATSDYTSDANSSVVDDGTTEPKRDSFDSGGGMGTLSLPDTLPWIRFARSIERPLPRTVSITIPAYPGFPDTTALATITASVAGRFYVQNDSSGHIAWVKDFTDDGTRKVYLTKHGGPRGEWRIRRMTPLNYVTHDAPWPIEIASLRLEARPSGLTYEYTSPDTLLDKRELPGFVQGDTVRVTVTVQGDSANWVFLHYGDSYFHQREALYRTSPTTFVREWTLARDSLRRGPLVLGNAADVISWPTLFGDTLAPYNSRAWVLPYVVLRTPNQDRP
jgi:hypothetical protein